MYFLVINYGGGRITPKYIFAQIALVVAQAFFVAGITTAYSKAQRPKHRRHGRRKETSSVEKEQSAEESGGPPGQVEPPPEEEEEEFE